MIEILIALFIGFLIGYYSVDCLTKKSVSQALVRQAGRWAIASEQDSNPLIAVLHSNYGVGYFSALNDIMSSSDIEKYNNIDSVEFMRKLQQVQDKANRSAVRVCPSFGPKSQLFNN
jgi:hypothetical protein